MKRILYALASVLIMSGAAQAQTFATYNTTSDTSRATLVAGNTDVQIDNPIRGLSAPVSIKTTVLALSAPSGVDPQFCDNATCRSTFVGDIFRSNPYATTLSQQSLYHAIFLHMNTAPANSVAYISIRAEDSAGNYNRRLTFIAYKNSLGVTSTQTLAENDIQVYPNPAREAVNVVYNSTAGVKNIAIYNLIGKVVKIYRPLDDNSAKLDIDNIPAGVYFIRLMDNSGRVLATRRFTRQ